MTPGMTDGLKEILDFCEGGRLQYLAKIKKYKHKRFRMAKQYWAGMARQATCTKVLVEAYIKLRDKELNERFKDLRGEIAVQEKSQV